MSKMNEGNRRSRPALRAAGASLGVLVGTALVYAAAPLVVGTPQVTIWSSKLGSVSPAVAIAKKGDNLELLAREGKWVKVRFGGKEGYVFEKSLDNDKIAGAGGVKGLSADASASSMSTTAAAKGGFEDKAEEYAKAKNLNTANLNKVLQTRVNVEPRFPAFSRDGKVGPNR